MGRLMWGAMPALVAAVLMSGCAADVAEPLPAPAQHAAGDPAAAGAAAGAPHASGPHLVVDTLEGERFDLAQRRGEWVVVNFWATWCKPCLKEIPDLSQLHEGREDLSVIGLAYEEIEPSAMRDFLQQHPASYPIAILDPYAESPAGDFEVPRGLPMTYLISPAGLVAQRFLGPVTSEEINQAIAEHRP